MTDAIMQFLLQFPPAFIMIAAALLVIPACGKTRNIIAIAASALTLFLIHNMPETQVFTLPFLEGQLDLLRVDSWSKVFGYVFTASATLAFIYGLYTDRKVELSSALLYIGSALGVVFAADLITVYIFWELMAITSVLLIFARGTEAAKAAGFRYILVHIVGGLVLLAGIVLQIHDTGSAAFAHFTLQSTATWLMLIGILVNAAAIPFSSWLPDAYPEATVFGGVILSAYTSKTAVYALVRGFAGWDILIPIGAAMIIYGIVYGLLENDMRRVLAYSIVNQVGFMLCAIGIGTPLALAGACAHAVCHIIYKSLLWMSTGAVLHQTGKSKLTDLGGLYKHMPLTATLFIIGALSMALPLTSSFTCKSIIILAAEKQHLFWPWLILELGSIGVFFNAGLRVPYFVFFSKPSTLKPKEASSSMLFPMAVLAGLCIYLGVNPSWLYSILPNSETVLAYMPTGFSEIYLGQLALVISKLQMILFSVLLFIIFLPILKNTSTISLDIDWLYRKGSRALFAANRCISEAILSTTDSLINKKATAKVTAFSDNAAASLLSTILSPFWETAQLSEAQEKKSRKQLYTTLEKSNLPISIGALLALVLISALILL